MQHHRLARCDGGSALCAGEALILPYKCTADEQAPAHLSEHRPGLSKDSPCTVTESRLCVSRDLCVSCDKTLAALQGRITPRNDIANTDVDMDHMDMSMRIG